MQSAPTTHVHVCKPTLARETAMQGWLGAGGDAYYKDKLVELQSSANIPARWHGTPIENFIQAQNFGYPLFPHPEPQVLISTCIEFRYSLPVPNNYAYVIRTAGGRLIGSEFAVGYVLARGVKNILLVAHNDCGMTKIAHHKEAMIEAYVAQGWSRAAAEGFIQSHAPRYAIKDELDALEQEYHRLKKIFTSVHVAPLFLYLSDRRVHIPKWYCDFIQQGLPAGTSAVADVEIKQLL